MRTRRPISLTEFLSLLPRKLAGEDLALIAAAREVLLRHYRPHWHTIAAAIRGRDGRIWTGLHLGTVVGRLSTCAEAIALGRAVLEGDGRIETIAALRHPKPGEAANEPELVSPCGACREMIFDYDPEAMVIVPGAVVSGESGPLKLPVRALLPLPYRR